MKTQIVEIDCSEMLTWESFHEIFQRKFGFPKSYGHNMNSWIDCMMALDVPDDGLSDFKIGYDEILALQLRQAEFLRRKNEEILEALIECSSFVNFRRMEKGEQPILTLMFVDFFKTIDKTNYRFFLKKFLRMFPVSSDKIPPDTSDL